MYETNEQTKAVYSTAKENKQKIIVGFTESNFHSIMTNFHKWLQRNCK